MNLPVLTGTIGRRVLLNFRADPQVVQRLLPSPLKVQVCNGSAVVGVCLIRLEQLRPSGFPHDIGLTSENMAHRVAIRFPSSDGWRDGVFVWRRETDLALLTFLGGRLFPGVHHAARFTCRESNGTLEMSVQTRNQEADVWFRAKTDASWPGTPSFPTFADAREFFRQGDCGFSCGLREGKLEGLQLRTLRWDMTPLHVDGCEVVYFADGTRFPAGSVEFDSALLMRGIPHEWHRIQDIPELAAAN